MRSDLADASSCHDLPKAPQMVFKWPPDDSQMHPDCSQIIPRWPPDGFQISPAVSSMNALPWLLPDPPYTIPLPCLILHDFSLRFLIHDPFSMHSHQDSSSMVPSLWFLPHDVSWSSTSMICPPWFLIHDSRSMICPHGSSSRTRPPWLLPHDSFHWSVFHESSSCFRKSSLGSRAGVTVWSSSICIWLDSSTDRSLYTYAHTNC